MKNLAQMLLKDTIEQVNTVLLSSNGEEKISGKELYLNIQKGCCYLEQEGISCGEKVIMQIHSKKYFIMTILSFIKMGAVPIILPVCINQNAADHLKKIISENPEARLVADEEGMKLVKAFLPKMNMKDAVVVDSYLQEGAKDIFALYPCQNSIEGETAFIIYSSGSTAEPKGVMMTHTGIISMLKETAVLLSLEQQDTMMSWLPIEHTFGLIYFLLLPIYVKCKQSVHMDALLFAQEPLQWLKAMEEYQAAVTAAPNFAYQLIIKQLKSTEQTFDLSNVRYILNGGEPISKKVMREFYNANQKFGLKENCIIPIYGMTETSGAVILNFPYTESQLDIRKIKDGIGFDMKSLEILQEDIVCQGSAITGCTVQIVDDYGTALGENTVGNIQLKGDFLCKGYLNRKSEELFSGEWLNTGDIGLVQKSRLYIVGRKKDMYFMHGKNIYMRDIEQIILDTYGVRSAACGENITTEENLKVYLFMELAVHEEERESKKKEIIRLLQQKIGVKLEDVIFKNSMFMTEVGKFSKAELLKRYYMRRRNEYA